jgi:hypothetical protein
MMIYFLDTCVQLESDYQNKVLKAKPKFLIGPAWDYLTLLEKGKFCEEIFTDGDDFD